MSFRKCTATSKRTGEPCQARAVNGFDVCYHHGGKTPRGAALPQFKHGRYSKALPTRMQAAYEAANNDPELLDLKRSVALIDARLIDLLSRVDTGESGAVWKAVSKAYADLRQAISGGKSAEVLKALAALDGEINRGNDDYAAWSEIGRLLDDRRKHVETQQRVELAGERAVSVNELATFMGALLSLVQTVVSNPKEKQQIAEGLDRLITPNRTQLLS